MITVGLAIDFCNALQKVHFLNNLPHKSLKIITQLCIFFPLCLSFGSRAAIFIGYIIHICWKFIWIHIPFLDDSSC